ANKPFHEYLIAFQELAYHTQWNQASLLARLKDGLSDELKEALAFSWNKLTTMEDLIDVATQASLNLKTCEMFHNRFNSLGRQNNFNSRRTAPAAVTPSTGLSPMDIDAISIKKLTLEEYQHCKTEHFCLYCAGLNHIVRNCPIKKPLLANVMSFDDAENSMAKFSITSGLLVIAALECGAVAEQISCLIYPVLVLPQR
ncbi:hypothetical protein BGZ83_003609, partial [Gryganskiella cystojenkinii]